MRWHAIFAVLTLPLTALAGPKAGSDRFAKSFSQSLPMKLDDNKYNKLTEAPRDYSVVVLLTAMGARFGCEVCHGFQPEWELLAKSWQKGDKAGESRVLFGTLDFLDGKDTFVALRLDHAPVIMLFLPTTGPHARADPSPLRFDFTAGLQGAEYVHSWISRHLPEGPRPAIVRPFNWSKLIITTVSVLGGITLLSVSAPYLLPVIQNRNLWAGISLIAVLLFTSGHMFNHIRKVPYVSGDGKGGISYFAGGFQNQFGLETQIVAAIYGVLAFATISLAVKVPRMVNPKAQQVAVIVWAGVWLVVYSFLLSIFRIKNGGYPFWLPPF